MQVETVRTHYSNPTGAYLICVMSVAGNLQSGRPFSAACYGKIVRTGKLHSPNRGTRNLPLSFAAGAVYVFSVEKKDDVYTILV